MYDCNHIIIKKSSGNNKETISFKVERYSQKNIMHISYLYSRVCGFCSFYACKFMYVYEHRWAPYYACNGNYRSARMDSLELFIMNKRNDRGSCTSRLMEKKLCAWDHNIKRSLRCDTGLGNHAFVPFSIELHIITAWFSTHRTIRHWVKKCISYVSDNAKWKWYVFGWFICSFVGQFWKVNHERVIEILLQWLENCMLFWFDYI